MLPQSSKTLSLSPGTKVWDAGGDPKVTSDTPGGCSERGGPGALQHGGLTCLQSAPQKQRGAVNCDRCVFILPSRYYDSWGTLTSMGRRKTCLETTSSRGVCRPQGYVMRSSLRLLTRYGETATPTTLSEAGCCCWPASAASPPHPGWTNTC